jgi:hypothetical protein
MRVFIKAFLAGSALALFGCNQTEQLTQSRLTVDIPEQQLALSTAGSLTLKSGQSISGGRDQANVLVACTGDACPSSALPQAALVIPKHSAWAATMSGTSWINPTVNPPAPGYVGYSAATYRNTFSLPANAIHDPNSASISIRITADNAATVKINGVTFVTQTDPPCNFCSGDNPKTYSTTFTPSPTGTNVLEILHEDWGGAMGLNYLATVTYETAPPVNCPDGYTNGAEVQAFSVSGTGGMSSSVSLLSGRPYVIQSSGSFAFAGGNNSSSFRNDAYYRTGDNWASFDGPWPQFGLSIDGSTPDWGPYNSDHVYRVAAFNENGQSVRSGPDTGYRGAPAVERSPRGSSGTRRGAGIPPRPRRGR